MSNVWDVIAAPAIRNEIKYVCCPEPFVDLTFSLIIRRRATFYAYILILPCVLLTSLTLVLFWIPPESPAKMQLGRYIILYKVSCANTEQSIESVVMILFDVRPDFKLDGAFCKCLSN